MGLSIIGRCICSIGPFWCIGKVDFEFDQHSEYSVMFVIRLALPDEPRFKAGHAALPLADLSLQNKAFIRRRAVPSRPAELV
jgi:hypothetical protein